ncbi:MAG: ribonuclease HI family protein [Candidatus Omnitrophica bacterium]|nr:ribonuclease HI family protein [Candidatus Omnitrophota bacterium]
METLTVYIDGASKGNPGKASIGIVIYSEKKLIKKYGVPIGNATNNSAEYMALITALIDCLSYCPADLEIKSDSQLLVKQMQKEYKVRDEGLQKLQFIASRLISRYNSVAFTHIPREENREADKAANQYMEAGQKQLF